MLDTNETEIAETRLSKKLPLSDADVRTLLASVDEVIMARGKNVKRAAAGEVSLDDLRGPTGGFRAPMLRVGKTLLVGFHDATLREVIA